MEDELIGDDAEFAQAFNEGEERAGVAPPQDDHGAGAAPAGIDAGDTGEAGGGAPAAPAVAVALAGKEEAAPGAASAGADDEIEKERQRLRSWEGRLKAREAELSAGGKAPEGAAEQASEALEGVSEAAAGEGSTELAQAASEAAEAVESGAITPEQAMAQLKEDFGEEFLEMIKTVVMATAKTAVEPVSKKVDDAVSTLNSSEERRHFGAIAAKHPDFREVGGSDEFKSFIASMPEDAKKEAERVAASGAADEVVALLDSYKEAKKAAGAQKGPAAEAPTDQSNEPAMEALEGVRSGGVRLPEKPQLEVGDYEGAWDQF